jgi:hypothetical protein
MHRIARALHAHGHSPITGYACSHAIKGRLNLIYGVTATELAGRKQRLAACRGEARPWKGSQMAATSIVALAVVQLYFIVSPRLTRGGRSRSPGNGSIHGP